VMPCGPCRHGRRRTVAVASAIFDTPPIHGIPGIKELAQAGSETDPPLVIATASYWMAGLEANPASRRGILSPGVLLAPPDRLEGLLEVPVVTFEEQVPRGAPVSGVRTGWGVTGTRAGAGGRAAIRRCRRAEPRATRAARCRGRWHTAAPNRARSGAWQVSPCPATRSESIAIMPRDG
jgi:hypothetical protein